MTLELSPLERIADGIQIILKYGKGEICAEHDQLWIGHSIRVSKEDAKALEDLGWFEDSDSWSHFV